MGTEMKKKGNKERYILKIRKKSAIDLEGG